MRRQQENIRAKQFLSKKNLDKSNFALRMRRRNNAQNKNKKHVRKYKEKKA